MGLMRVLYGSAKLMVFAFQMGCGLGLRNRGPKWPHRMPTMKRKEREKLTEASRGSGSEGGSGKERTVEKSLS